MLPIIQNVCYQNTMFVTKYTELWSDALRHSYLFINPGKAKICERSNQNKKVIHGYQEKYQTIT